MISFIVQATKKLIRLFEIKNDMKVLYIFYILLSVMRLLLNYIYLYPTQTYHLFF